MEKRAAFKKMLLIRTDRMGDLLLTLPAVRAIRQNFPASEVTLMLRQELEPLIQGHPDVDRTLPWNPRDGTGWIAISRWGWRLRKEGFDVAVVFNPTKLFHAATFLAGIPVRIGYRRKLPWLLTTTLPDTKSARTGHEAEYNLELGGLLGIPPSTPVLRLPRRPASEQEADRLLSAGGIHPTKIRPIALHPWTSNRAKGWPHQNFQELARRLSGEGYRLVVIGEPGGSPAQDEWNHGLPPGVTSLVGQVPLQHLPALLSRCALLVSNDSGPVHVASAVGIPTVVVAPKEHGDLLQRWRPLGEGHRLLLSPTVEEVVASVRLSAPHGP